jgi:uncharacterized damage-inducible protein DinB
MNKSEAAAKLGYFNLVHGVTLRVISALGDADLEFRPAPGLRTPRELVFHIYAQERILAEAARRGRFTPEDAGGSNPEDPSVTPRVEALATVGELKSFAEECHRAAVTSLEALSDEELERPVESPFGTFPAWRFFEFAYDEHWHHRGQLYTYLRLLGKEPPMLYDYQ